MENKLLQQFLIPFIMLISLVYAVQTLGKSPTMLSNIFHHQNGAGIKHYLEAGDLVFYFSQKPLINIVKTDKKDACEEQVFFFPNVVLQKKKLQSTIDRLNKEQEKNYSIQIEFTKKPMAGMRVAIRYDTNNIALTYEEFEAINLQKGIVFRLYNKQILKKIRANKEKPILKTVCNTSKPRVVIDCGHGYNDVGAVGLYNTKEKEVCLSIGIAAAAFLHKKGYEVLLTRTEDEALLLDERTLYANRRHANVFVSVHANYASNGKARGIETFCTASSLFSQQFCSLNKQDVTVIDNFSHELNKKSMLLARSIQQNACQAVCSYHQNFSIDRKVKLAVSQVLIGTRMPAALVEVGFLSNESEAFLLGDKKYQQTLARGISNGVMAFIAQETVVNSTT